MRLYGYFRSSASWRVRIALALKGLSADYVPVHLTRDGGEQRAPEHAERNPQKMVPVLESDAGERLTQSLAIVEWLEETHPEPALLPREPLERARVRAFAQAIACDVTPFQNLRVLQWLRAEYGQDQAGIDRWCGKWIGDGLAACEALLAREPARGDFCFGATPGLADLVLVPQMFGADRFHVDLSAMPRLRAIRQACEAMPEFAGAHPSRQPDFEV